MLSLSPPLAEGFLHISAVPAVPTSSISKIPYQSKVLDIYYRVVSIEPFSFSSPAMHSFGPSRNIGLCTCCSGDDSRFLGTGYTLSSTFGVWCTCWFFKRWLPSMYKFYNGGDIYCWLLSKSVRVGLPIYFVEGILRPCKLVTYIFFSASS